MNPKMKQKKRNVCSLKPRAIADSISRAYLDDLDDFENRIAHAVCDPPVSRYFLNYARASVLKKFTYEEVTPERLPQRTVKAYKKFFGVNQYVAYTNALLALPRDDIHPSHQTDLSRVLLRARQFIHNVLGDLDTVEWFRKCKISGGTTVGLKYAFTNIEDKFSLPITATRRSWNLFEFYLRYDEQLCDILYAKATGHIAVGTTNDKIQKIKSLVKFVKGSELTTVAKTDEIDRVINKEPTASMWLQLGLMEVMYDRLRNIGLDVTLLQNLHKFRALLASVTGCDATIDWSSASDCVAYLLGEFLFPAKWWYVISAVRSPVAYLGNVEVDLQMVGTMGNGTTFPIETLVFLAIAVGASSPENSYSVIPDMESVKRISVYGDDCIVPTELAARFIWAATQCGFIVNEDKSFIDRDMRFRESCGGDYYHYRNVRPWYLRAPRDGRRSSIEAWMYVIFNTGLKKYMSYFGQDCYAYYSHFFEEWFSIMRQADFSIKVVPSQLPDDSGIQYTEDLSRILRLYSDNCRFNRVYMDIHGSISKYNYLAFEYDTSGDTDDSIRYWYALRNAHEVPLYRRRFFRLQATGRIILIHGEQQPEATPNVYNDKRKGGYVVRKGSCHKGFPH